LAVVAPVFLLLTYAICEFGRYMVLYSTASNAAYEAARAAMVHGASRDGGLDLADQLLQAVGTQNYTTTIQPDVITDETLAVTATVQIPFNDNAFLPAWFANGSVITRSCTLASEGARIAQASANPP
jgi:Flp pilus assembly protein TadG